MREVHRFRPGGGALDIEVDTDTGTVTVLALHRPTFTLDQWTSVLAIADGIADTLDDHPPVDGDQGRLPFGR